MTERILDDPFCGEMYDGQMVELLSRVLKTHVQERRRDLYIPFIEKATQEMNKHCLLYTSDAADE